MELTEDHFTVACDAWAAARDGNGIVIKNDFYPAAHDLMDAGWLTVPLRAGRRDELVVDAAG